MTRRRIFALLVIFLFIFSVPLATASAPLSIFRIDLAKPGDLDLLSHQKIQIYAELVGGAGEPYLLAGLTEQEADTLLKKGIALQGLGATPQEGELFLLFSPEAALLTEVRSLGGAILLEDGFQTVVMLPPGGGAQLEGMGATLRRLFLHPLILPQNASHLPQLSLPDPIVQAMMAQAQVNDASNLIGGLSGEWAVDVEGSPYAVFLPLVVK